MEESANFARFGCTPQQEVLSHIRALGEGAKEVRLSAARRRAVLADLERGAGAYRDLGPAAALGYAVAGSWGQLLFFLGMGLVLALGGAVFHVPAAALPAFALVIVYMMGPLRVIVGAAPLFGRASVALDGLEAMRLRVGAEVAEPAPRAEEPRPWGPVALRGVTYAYDRFVLGPPAAGSTSTSRPRWAGPRARAPARPALR